MDNRKLLILNLCINLITFSLVLSSIIAIFSFTNKTDAFVKKVNTQMENLNIQNYTEEVIYYLNEIKQELQNSDVRYYNSEIYNVSLIIKQDIDKFWAFFNRTAFSLS